MSLACLMMLLVTSCAGGVHDSFCLTQTPHRFADKSVSAMTTEEVRQEVEYNRYGQEQCGWKP